MIFSKQAAIIVPVGVHKPTLATSSGQTIYKRLFAVIAEVNAEGISALNADPKSVIIIPSAMDQS